MNGFHCFLRGQSLHPPQPYDPRDFPSDLTNIISSQSNNCAPADMSGRGPGLSRYGLFVRLPWKRPPGPIQRFDWELAIVPKGGLPLHTLLLGCLGFVLGIASQPYRTYDTLVDGFLPSTDCRPPCLLRRSRVASTTPSALLQAGRVGATRKKGTFVTFRSWVRQLGRLASHHPP